MNLIERLERFAESQYMTLVSKGYYRRQRRERNILQQEKSKLKSQIEQYNPECYNH